MNADSKAFLIENYRALLSKHGRGPRVGSWSAEGQAFRFRKLVEIGNLDNARVLDIGCGLGDLADFIRTLFRNVEYMGVDIVPELIAAAQLRHPNDRFSCRDPAEEPLDERFDFVFISGLFNHAIPDCDAFMREMLPVAFAHCTKALGFNFISTHVNYRDPAMAYHDPVRVLESCIQQLSPKALLHHHYKRCDVAVFVYR